MRTEVKVGDICLVTSSWHIYTEPNEFTAKAGHLDIDEERYVDENNAYSFLDKEVRVLYVARIYPESDYLGVIVETTDSLNYSKFMINPRGLTAVNKLFIKEYLLGKRITEMIPDKYVNESLTDAILLRNPLDIQYVNADLITDGVYIGLVKKDGGLLGLIPEERRSQHLCALAYYNEPYAMRFIPEAMKSLVFY